MAARVKPLAIGAARPEQTNKGFVRFLIHRSFFDEGVDPSKRRCRDRRGSGRSAGTAKGSAPRTLQAGWRSITLGCRPKVPGMEAATPMLRSQVHAPRGAATIRRALSTVTHGEETAQGNAEGGGVTVGEAEARLRRKRVEFIFDRDANSIHL
jgi:hypothetical protein